MQQCTVTGWVTNYKKTGHVQTAQSQLPLVFVSPTQLSR